MQNERERRADEIAERHDGAQQAVADSQVRVPDVATMEASSRSRAAAKSRLETA